MVFLLALDLQAPIIPGEGLFITVLTQVLVRYFSSTCQKCQANNLLVACSQISACAAFDYMLLSYQSVLKDPYNSLNG
jgi:hypothetical protein